MRKFFSHDFSVPWEVYPAQVKRRPIMILTLYYTILMRSLSTKKSILPWQKQLLSKGDTVGKLFSKKFFPIVSPQCYFRVLLNYSNIADIIKSGAGFREEFRIRADT